RPALHAAGGARDARRRARAGHGAHDGRCGAHGPADGRRVRPPAALVRRRDHRRGREGMTAARRWLAAAAGPCVAGWPGRARAGTPVVLDDFEDVGGWDAFSSEGTHVWLTPEPGHSGNGMHVGFDLNSGGGWVIVRKTFPLTLPENYAFTFQLRGD